MKSCTSINESWVAALQHDARVRKPASHSMQSVSYTDTRERKETIMLNNSFQCDSNKVFWNFHMIEKS